jgi:hypothetical protein
MRGELIGALSPLILKIAVALTTGESESWIDRKDGTTGKLE